MANFSNRFALLNEEDDEPAAPAAAPPTQTTKPAPSTGDKPSRGGARGARGGYAGRGGPRKVFKDDSAPRATDEGPVGDDPVKDDRGGSGTRGRGRGRGAPRGARGARGGARGGAEGRPDRHSQTDNVDSEKKEHQGWGGDEGKREMEDEDWGVADAQVEASAQTPTKAAANGDNTAAEPTSTPAPEPEEDNSKTYEEYLAERAAAGKSSIGGTIAARKANEGSDETQWKAGQLLEKVTNDDFFVGKQAQARARKAKEDKRQFLEIEPVAYRPSREGGDRGRGGRGGGRGGFRGGEGRGGRGGRGGFGGERSSSGRGSARSGGQGANVNLDDTSAFPSL